MLNRTTTELPSFVRQSTYLPYGQEWNPQITTNHYKFTGKERDSEDNLDYFGARYYSSTMGRWMSPDWADKPEPVPYADLSDPQSLNLYGYVRNNPASKADADGHCPFCVLALEGAEAGAEVGAIGGPIGSAVGALVGAAGGIFIGYEAAEQTHNVITYYKKAEPGSRPGKDFTKSGKKDIDAANAAANEGQKKCTNCDRDVKSQANKKGEPTPEDQLQRHHKLPKSQGGSGTPENGEVLCPGCHKDIHYPPTPDPQPLPQPQPSPPELPKLVDPKMPR